MPDLYISPKNKKTENIKKDISEAKTAPLAPVIKDNDSHEASIPDVCKKPSLWKRLKEPLLAYVVNPEGLRFESQEDKEEIILLLRQHPITNLPWISAAILMLFAPVAVFPFLSFLNPFPYLPLSYHLILTLFWYTLTFSLVLVNYLHWFYNVYLVTNERIVDVDFNNLVHRQLSSTRVSKIQDVTYKVNGVIRSIFDYGDVFIQTAGTEENFEFHAAPQPQLVVKKIGELIEKKEEGQHKNNQIGVSI